MRWRQAARDLEDPEIAAVTDADAEHLERAMTLRHYQQQPGTSSSSSRRGRESKRATPSASAASGNADADASCSLSSPFFHQRGGRHGLLPPPPWEVVVRDIERDRRSNSGDTTGEFAHQWSTQLSSSATMASSPSIESGDDEEDEEEDEEEGAEAEDALESAKLLLAGGVAGAVSKTATAPLARLTILYQVQGMTAAAASRGGGAVSAAATSTSAASAAVSPIAGLPLRQALRAVVEREGVASLWRGNFVTVLHRLPYSAVNFWAYERLSEAWIAAEDKRSESSGENSGGEASTSTSDTSRRLACGGAAGMAACTLAYPLDLVRTRLAASSSPAFSVGGGGGGSSGGLAASAAKNKRSNHPHPPRLSVARTLADVVRADGPRGLYRGLGATLAQVGPSLALNYTAYGALRAKWMSGKQPGEPPTIMMSLVCGAAAGLISSTATFPLDLIRRRMQLGGGASPGSSSSGSSAGVKPPRPTYAGVVRDVLARAGPAGFYAGIMPEYYKVAPGVAIGFCTYEACRELLGVSPSLAFR